MAPFNTAEHGVVDPIIPKRVNRVTDPESHPEASLIVQHGRDGGALLSKAARRFNSSEVQQFDNVRIASASSHNWRVPIAAQLDASAIPEQGIRGRLTVNVALLFGEAGSKTSLLTLYDTDLAFTRASLSE